MTRSSLVLLFGLVLLASVPTQAATIYTGIMIGANEVPPNSSAALGFSLVTVSGNTLAVQLQWADLEGGTPSAAHIHCCVDPGNNVGVAVGFPAFPAVTTGTYSNTFNLLDSSIYTTNFLNNFGGGTAAGAMAALIAGLDAGRAYSNIHNATFQGGEIRADLAQIPEPSTALLLAAGLLGAACYTRRRRS